MKTAIPKQDKRKRILKQEPLSDTEMKRLEKAMKPVDASQFMVKAKQVV